MATNDTDVVSLEVCDASDLKDGSMKEVDFGEGKVLLTKVDGKISATTANCTHYGAPLVKGVLRNDGSVICPWHGARFCSFTGDIEDAPGLDSLYSFKTSLTGGKITVTASKSIVEGKKTRIPLKDKKAQVHKKTKTSEDQQVVIVGGGSGGLGTIEGLRENGFKGKITLFTTEPHGPIDRTKLSKTLMSDVDKLAFRSAAEYEASPWDIDLRTSTAVKSIDLAKSAVTFEGGELKYDYLVIATGASPRDLPVEGGDLEGVLKLRNVEQAKVMDAAVKEGAKVVFVGSSFIAMEVAVVATKRKLASLDVVGMEEYPFEAVLGKEVGKGLKAYHEKQGMKFHMNAEIESFAPSEKDSKKVGSVKLKDGTILPCDAVVLGIGAKLRTELLDEAGVALEKDGGVEVDGHFRIKGHKNVFAVGDIAHYPGPIDGKPTRIEHWNVAGNAGRHVAGTIADPASSSDFSKVPIFWSAQGGQLRYCGNGKGFDAAYVKGDASELKFEAYYGKAGKVIAVASMGVDPLVSQASELMRLDMMPSMDEIKGGKALLDIKLVGGSE